MKLLLDACVLFPTVMREVLLGAAQTGAYVPLWSDRILEEWARAAARSGPVAEAQARGEIALVKATFPQAVVAPDVGLENRLWLPDDNDIHVLAAAVSGSADAIITLNAKDFPRGLLVDEGLARFDPDAVMVRFWQDDPSAIGAVAAKVLDQARALSGQDWTLRGLMKKARLPRFGKALEQRDTGRAATEPDHRPTR